MILRLLIPVLRLRAFVLGFLVLVLCLLILVLRLLGLIVGLSLIVGSLGQSRRSQKGRGGAEGKDCRPHGEISICEQAKRAIRLEVQVGKSL
jgi:hypothetical protein